MKAPKLSRKSSKPTPNDVSPDTSVARHEPTLKTSLDELNHPTSREMLRQHFTGAFPETVRKEVQEWDHSSSSMESNGQRLSRSTSSLNVGNNPAAASSSSTLDLAGVGNKRLSTVRETQPIIDIAQAIQLLQELKKSASPQDLVALHKALLPTRDSLLPSPAPMPVNEEGSSDTFTSQSVIRRGSMAPAGFATRGGASEDPLRRIEEMKTTRKTGRSKARDSLGLRKKESKSSIAALDLADDTAPSKYARAATPVNEDYSPLGSYRPGTLRVTNGAASPEPSIATRPSVELLATDPQPPAASLRESQDYATAPTTPLDRQSHEYHPARSSLHQSTLADDLQSPRTMFTRVQSDLAVPPSQEQHTPDVPRQGRPRNTSISGIPHPEIRDESVPRIYKRTRPQRSREPSQTRTPQPRQRSVSATPHSREPSLSRIPIKVASRASLSGNYDAVARKVSEQSLVAPVRRSIDDGRVSPMLEDIPRYAQRWSHRASHLEQSSSGENDGVVDGAGEQSASYADKEAMLNRLSTVYDREDDEGTAHETPEAALSKLTGVEGGQASKQSLENRAPAMMDTTTPSRRFLNNIRGVRPIPQKADSGYGTDGSSQEQQAKLSTEAGQTGQSHPLREESDEGVAMDEYDSRGLYSLQEILNSPDSALPTTAASSPRTPANHKKHSSFLKLTNAIKGQSTLTLATSPPVADENFAGSPLEQRDGKGQKKKLQKPMPDSVKRQFKEKRRREKEEKASRAPILCEGFVAPDTPDMATPDARMQRFSWERPTPLPTPTASTFHPNVSNSSAAPLTAEAVGDMSFTSADEATATSAPGVTRNRSKSLGRARTPVSPQPGSPSPQDSNQMQRSWSLKRKRLARRATDHGPTRPDGLAVRGIPCLKTNDDDGDDEAPMWTDHSSVSQTLGCNPYDISTTMFRRTVALPGMVTTTISSPHQITTTVSRTKTGGLQGMDSSMASELARMKSRDVAISNNEQVYDRPRMARPKNRSVDAQSSNAERIARLPNAVAEPRSSPRRASFEPALGTPSQPVELSTRPMSTYAESIPPMPELPADVRRVISKVDDMVAKRIRDEHAPLPRDSTQPSPSNSGRSSEEKGCDSTLSVADAVRKRLEAKKKLDASPGERERPTGLRKRPSGPRQQSSSSLQTRVHSVLRTKSSESIQIGLGSDVEVGESPATPTPGPEAQQEAVPSVWSRHAALWKERRQSAGLSLGKPVVDDDMVRSPISPLSPSQNTAPSSPAIMVSRYITPHANEIAAQTPTISEPKNQHRRRKSAADQADAYRALIGDDEIIRTDSPASIAPSPPQQQHHPSTLRPSTQPAPRSRSPGGRVITPSGNFHPYTPADAPTAEHSRAISLAKLTAATRERETRSLLGRGTQSLDIARDHDTTPRTPGRKSDDRALLPSRTSPSHSPSSSLSGAAYPDRYSGGLEYGFERGVGVGGSAGTRGNTDDGVARKSKQLSAGWGVDLSDVPVFLTRVG